MSPGGSKRVLKYGGGAAKRDPSHSSRASLQGCVWLLWQPCMAGLLLQVLARTNPQSRGGQAGDWVMVLLSFINIGKTSPPETDPVFWSGKYSKVSFLLFPAVRPHNDAGSPLTFSKFEEKKNMEKGRKVNTMRRLFWGGPSPPKRPGDSLCTSSQFSH